MRRLLMFLAVQVLLAGCSNPPQKSLSEVMTRKVYAADLQKVYDAVRFHCVKDAFIVDRFEQESGSIIAHKVYGGSGFRAEYSEPAERLIVMRLRVHEIAPGRTEAITTFTFGSGKVVATRDDETILVGHYSSLYSTLDDQLGPARQENP